MTSDRLVTADTIRTKAGLPLIAAPMFLVSSPALVIAACRAGVIGAFPALNQRTGAGFAAWLEEIAAALDDTGTATPYAVNLIVHGTNARLAEDLEICAAHKVPVVITSLGIDRDVIETVHGYGGLVLHDVTTVRHARKAAESGVDGLIAVAAGAGGHGGALNPFAFVHEIRGFFDGLLVLAGGLSHGADILAAEVLGADFVYMGTRFINTAESAAPDDYKKMICDAAAADIVYTPAVSGIPGNFLKQSLENAGLTAEELARRSAAPSGLKNLAEEAKAWKTVWSAGQGVGAIDDIPHVKDLIDTLKDEYDAARRKVSET